MEQTPYRADVPHPAGRSPSCCGCLPAPWRMGGWLATARRISSSAGTCATTSPMSSPGRGGSGMARPKASVGELGAVQYTPGRRPDPPSRSIRWRRTSWVRCWGSRD